MGGETVRPRMGSGASPISARLQRETVHLRDCRPLQCWHREDAHAGPPSIVEAAKRRRNLRRFHRIIGAEQGGAACEPVMTDRPARAARDQWRAEIVRTTRDGRALWKMISSNPAPRLPVRLLHSGSVGAASRRAAWARGFARPSNAGPAKGRGQFTCGDDAVACTIGPPPSPISGAWRWSTVPAAMPCASSQGEGPPIPAPFTPHPASLKITARAFHALRGEARRQ